MRESICREQRRAHDKPKKCPKLIANPFETRTIAKTFTVFEHSTPNGAPDWGDRVYRNRTERNDHSTHFCGRRKENGLSFDTFEAVYEFNKNIHHGVLSLVGIPAKLNALSEGKPNGIPG